MALIKKLSGGGTNPEQNIQKLPNDYQDFENFLIKEMDALPTKQRRRLEESGKARQFLDLYKSGDFEKAYSQDPINRTYAVDTSKITNPSLQGINWTGHSQELSPDLLGRQIAGKDKEQESMTWVADAYRRYKQTKSEPTNTTTAGTVSSTTTGYEKSLPKLSNYVIDTYYGGGSEGADTWATKFGKIDNDEERQKKLRAWSLEHTNAYIKDASDNKTGSIYKDMDKVKALNEALNKNADWKEISEKADALGWNLDDYLLKPNEKQAFDAEKKTLAATKAKEELLKVGLTEDLANQFASQGYTYDPNFGDVSNWQNQQWMTNVLKGTVALKNPTTNKHIVLKNNAEFSGEGDKYGKAGYKWGNVDGAFVFHSPSASELAVIKAKNAPINYAPYWASVLKDSENPLSNILSKSYYSLDDAESKFNQTLSQLNSEGITDERVDELNKVAATLRDVMKTGSHEDRNRAFELYKKLTPIFKNNTISVSDNYKHGGFSYKSGGIMKFQKGGGIEAYAKTHKPYEIGSTTSTNNIKFKDLRGTLGNINGWEAASLLGTAASFVPGVGAIGGAVTTVADIAGDISKDGFQASDVFNLNTAANLGFTALAFFGAGAVGAAFKGATKGLKVADKAIELGKVVDKANKLKASTKVVQSLELAKKVGDTSTDLAKAIDKLDDAAKAPAILEKLGLKTVEEAREVLTTAQKSASYVNNSGLKKALGITQITELISKAPSIVEHAGKVGKMAATGVRGATIASGAMALPGMYKDVKEGGLGNIQSEDLKRVAFGAHAAGSWLKNKEILRALERQATQGGTSAKTTFKVAGEENPLQINQVLEPIKEKKAIFGIGKKKIEETNAKKLDEFKKSIADIYKKENVKTGKTLTDEQIASMEDISGIRATKSGQWSIGEEAKMNKSIWRDQRDYKLAKKAINKYQTSETQATAKSLKGETSSETQVAAKPEVYKHKKFSKEETTEMKKAFKDKTLKNLQKIKKFTNPAEKKRVAIKIKDLKKELNVLKKGGILKYQTPAQALEFGKQGKYPILGGWEFNKAAQQVRNTTLGDIQVIGSKPTKFNTFKINNNDYIEEGSPAQQTTSRPTITAADLGKGIVMTDDFKTGFGTTQKDIDAISKAGNYLNSGSASQNQGTFLPWLKNTALQATKSIDKTDLINLGLYANTIATNRKAFDAQRQSVASGMYSLPYMQHSYVRMDTPYSLHADKQAALLEGKASRMAKATSDFDKGLGARLSGNVQANTIREKATLADQQRLDQQRAQQAQINANISKVNLDILGKNRGMAANAFSKIHLLNAKQDVAQSTALNNLALAAQRNAGVKNQNQFKAEMFSMLQDPKYKAAQKSYTEAHSPEIEKAVTAAWELEKKKPYQANLTLEQFQGYKDLLAKRENTSKVVNSIIEPMKLLQTAQSYGVPFSTYQGYQTAKFKKGGSIKSTEAKIRASKNFFYKIIEENNKNVVSKDKLPKNTEDYTATEKLFYGKIMENNALLTKVMKSNE